MSIAIATKMLENRVWVHEFITLSRERLCEAYEYTTSKLRAEGVEYLQGG